jgi:hypothetical protein
MRKFHQMAIALLVCAWITDANAAEYPDLIRRHLEDATKLCSEHGGTMRTPDDRTVRLIDVNDDGHDDYVIDYRYFRCEGGPANLFCTDNFCSIAFLSWRSDNEWKLFLHASVADWRVRKGDKPALLLLQRQFCQRPNDPQCTLVYTFRNGKMYGKMQDAKYSRPRSSDG